VFFSQRLQFFFLGHSPTLPDFHCFGKSLALPNSYEIRSWLSFKLILFRHVCIPFKEELRVMYEDGGRFIVQSIAVKGEARSPGERTRRAQHLAPSNKRCFNYMQRRFGIGFLLPVVLVLATGCQFTQTGFSRLAGDAGATFAAASTTIEYTHEGKLTPAYAASSFVN